MLKKYYNTISFNRLDAHQIIVTDVLSILLLFNHKDNRHGLAYELCRARTSKYRGEST